MIDYEKLKLAHELAEKYAQKNEYIGFECHFNNKEQGFAQYYNLYDLQRNQIFSGLIDDLITKLRQLTQIKCKCGVILDYDNGVDKCYACLAQPEQKYKEGEFVVAYGWDGEIELCQIMNLSSGNNNHVHYEVKFASGIRSFFDEDRLYPTKAALIDSQITYWNNLAEDEAASFEHCDICCEPIHNCDCDTQTNQHEVDVDKRQITVNIMNDQAVQLPCGDQKDECQHEPEMNFAKDDRPRFEKGKGPKCRKWGEIYSVECQHEYNGGLHWSAEHDGFACICTKCGEFYR